MTREWLAADPTARPSGAWCIRCKGWTYMPIEVGYVERQGGPGFPLYACPSHAVAMVPGPMPGELERDA